MHRGVIYGCAARLNVAGGRRARGRLAGHPFLGPLDTRRPAVRHHEAKTKVVDPQRPLSDPTLFSGIEAYSRLRPQVLLTPENDELKA